MNRGEFAVDTLCQAVDFRLHFTVADRLPLLAAILGPVDGIGIQVGSNERGSERESGIVPRDCAHLIPVLPVSGPQQPGVERTVLDGPPVGSIEKTYGAHGTVARLRISILSLPGATGIFREKDYSACHLGHAGGNPSGLFIGKVNVKQLQITFIIHRLPDRLKALLLCGHLAIW